jgi:hypothetical protein
MSNYLHNLLMRSTGTMETARPRLPSLFEPLPSTAFTPVDGVPDARPAREFMLVSESDEQSAPLISTATAEPSAPQASRPAARSQLPSQESAPSTGLEEQELPAPALGLPRRRRAVSIDPTLAEDDVVMEPSDTRAASDTPPQVERRQMSAAQSPLQGENASLKQSVPPPASIEREASVVSSEPRPLETVIAHERVTIKFEDRSDDARAANPAVQKQRQPEVGTTRDESSRLRPVEAEPQAVRKIFTDRIVERELSIERPASLLQDEPSTIRDVTNVKPETFLVHPRVARPEEEGGLIGASQRSRTPTPEQVVQVTIGRIEVRAVSPPARARAEQKGAPSPAQSLEDYLRQRAKGGGNR